ncbi:helix-turn-helix domain-containing protein [Dyadobacter sp. CY261]|uniref:helix-turn-helix domain-containing protein n=1 Tax=Dyadobacter sp. CY261 TaxID=2907203 RepID=UPI001F2D3FDB|nr:helix-turn-helix domain-containing protein [Dyadobacter sp. CY261]MCF0074355.1 helix-turn-helix domain-containing protein [Dyadobacter sp. CY261]
MKQGSGMGYMRSKAKEEQHREEQQRMEFPLHDLGESFFAMTTIENGDEHFFNGVHRHDFYEVLWFTEIKPDQTHDIDFNQYPIAPNQVFLLLPDQVHSMDQRDKCGFLMAISKDFFERLIGNDIFKLFRYSTNFSVTIPDCKLTILNTLTDLIHIEYQSEKRPAILESYLRSWFLHCIELQKETGEPTARDPRLKMLLESIENNYRRQRKAGFYANELSLSAKRLNELTRESFGKTISQMINERLILEAKREIGYVRKPIKEISYELGFSEPAYFTRFFGKQTGYAPEDFRKRISDLYG